MTDKKKPKAIILEQNDTIQKHAESILSNAGWDVICEQVSKNALSKLSDSVKEPFALFICNYKLPKMDGDDILQEVKTISPLTQKILLVPADETKVLISAIHKAEINACIIPPFNDQDLLVHSRTCLKQFLRANKKEEFKKRILQQNKKMLKIAKQLKQKSGKYKKVIKAKKVEILKLKSIKRELAKNSDQEISLSGFLEHKKVKPAPETFQKEFIDICKTIKHLFDKITGCHGSDPVILDLSNILSQTKEDSKKSESDLPEPAEKIIKAALTITRDKPVSDTDDLLICEASDTDLQEDATIDDSFNISFSTARVEAYIKKTSDFDTRSQPPTLPDILEMLKENQISYGIIDDKEIGTWISNSFDNKILIARGEEPMPEKDGKVQFNFKTQYTNPGKINEDGSIDFKQRGDIPFVNKGDSLAVKTPPEKGKSGIDVSGNPIQVDEAFDPVFTAGAGTQLSEDELTVIAAIEGQPNLDAVGTITVNPELAIPGDVDFETGNINFKGNIVVKGMVKEGFSVKGVSLTAKELEGADIELSGDLNISAGITDSKVSTQGNIHAKFINNSNIMTFGNLEISKEIIDSDIISSGSCLNQSGHILTSRITAKMGIEAGKIGTSSAKPARLKVGVDKHIEILMEKAETSLKESRGKHDLLKNEIKALEDEDQQLYKQVSEKAYIQDRAQLEIKKLKEPGQPDTAAQIKKLQEKAKKAKEELNKIFKTQDDIAKKIERIKEQITIVEEKNKTLVIEKKALKEFSRKEKPRAVITVAKKIAQDTTIKGPHSSLILKEDASRCKIQELAVDYDSSLKTYEMTISDP